MVLLTRLARGRLLDAGLLVAPPFVLAFVFGLPRTTKEALVFSGMDPTLVRAVTAHYVHFRGAHLLSNLGAYALLAPVAYVLCVAAGRRALFRVAAGTFLTTLPVVLSALNLAMFPDAVSFGFSGVVMAYLGLVPVGLGGYLADADVEPAFFLVGAFVVTLLGVPASPVRALVLVGTAALVVAYVGTAWGHVSAATLRKRLFEARAGWAAVAGGCLLVTYPVAAFPPEVVTDGSVLNLYQHVLGYAFGFLPAYLVGRIGDAQCANKYIFN